MKKTDFYAAMRDLVQQLEEDNKCPRCTKEPDVDQFKDAVYEALASSRNWEDVIHGMRLTRDIVRSEIALLKQGDGILLGVDDLIKGVEAGNRIEYDETHSWRWLEPRADL